MTTPDPAFVAFLRSYPTYPTTHIIDDLRAVEYARLDIGGHIYLDYAGGGLYAESQLRRHSRLLAEHVFGNPESSNPASQAATRLVNHAREYVLKFFNADPDEYLAIFTPTASGALKLVGESYDFLNGRFLLTFDNRDSVNGIREFARGAEVTYLPVTLPDLRVDASRLDRELARRSKSGHNLLAYPAQSDFSSVQHPLEWVDKAHQRGWDVLLDAAAFAPTNPLDLSKVKPDFVPISFYKMFGYPTGIGALIARKEALAKLHRPRFADRTINDAAAFEDGTIDYLNIPAVEIGLKHIEAIGYDVIHERVRCLTGWLLDNLTALKHDNGTQLARVYGPTTTEGRGGAVTVNFYDRNNDILDHLFIEEKAAEANISLRTRCFCNPAAGETALVASRVESDVCVNASGREGRLNQDDFRLCFDPNAMGAVRISVGMATNFKDAQGFLWFARGLLS